MTDNGTVADEPTVIPMRFICWISGQCVWSEEPGSLVNHAANRSISSFVVWEVDYETQRIIHLLATWVPDRWEFYDSEGVLRFMVGGRLHQWAAAYLEAASTGTLTAVALPLNVWPEVPTHPLYTPLGFALPVLHPAGWSYRWAPDVVAEHLGVLDQDEREAFLDAMYLRLAWWAELAATGLSPDEVDRAVDLRMLDLEDHTGWNITNRLLVAALSG